MAPACRRSSDLVLGESSFIACALVMLPLQHDSTDPVLCFHTIVLLKRAFPLLVRRVRVMSASLQKADIDRRLGKVRFVPKSA